MLSKQLLYILLIFVISDAKTDIRSDRKSRLRRQAIVPSKMTKFWTLPIKYMMDKSYRDKDKEVIVAAIKHIDENSCIRFKPTDVRESKLVENSVIVLNVLNEGGCDSIEGELVNNTQRLQPIYLNALTCSPLFGVALSEIVHTLGFYNEQNRMDSPKFVSIQLENIYPSIPRMIQHFLPFNDTNEIQNFDVPYDYGSIIQWSGMAASINFKPTIIATDPLFQHTMGQRTGLSFYDVKLLNRAYCKGKCPSFKSPCKKGGIRNPNNCTECFCPDGYGGSLCETVGKSDLGCTPHDQNIIEVTSTEKCLQSPNYGVGHYNVNSMCNWILKAPTKRNILMRFTGQFGLFQDYEMSCFHWIELKYRKNLEIGGPRFCGQKRPNTVLVSEGNEAVVSFRSNFEAPTSKRKGFRLCYKLGKRVKKVRGKVKVCSVKWGVKVWQGVCKKSSKCRFACGRQSCEASNVCCFKKNKMPPKDHC